MVQKMGFGEKTGIELPAETGGIVRPLSKWNSDSLASLSIGYEIGVSALQMTTAFATIANNGVKIRPRIIKEYRKAGEAPLQPSQSEQIQVVTPETARHLRTMLKQVVMTGTGRRAQLNGYTAAGKTGTAWKFNAKTKTVDSSKYISSFIGMAPADDPEIVIGVVMDEPRSGARDGGMVSAPVFREIAQRLLHELHVPTDAPIRQEILAEKDIPETPVADERIAGKQKIAGRPQKQVETPAEKEKQPSEKKTKDKEKEKIPGERQRFSAELDLIVIGRSIGYRFET
jgi:cell division protein FtsI (penicillin-binding protein 3)